MFNRKPALQTRVKFERCGHSGVREGQTKDAMELHYGKCKTQHFIGLDSNYRPKVRMT